ncbi:MAG TPA: hypothetical protein DIU15_11365 [Deltaproteobacteria bacterium]|nr:hypothetical protein [Deltaproteobacteria bacterium]HCP46636.1 hypothetical protein [Deltaproteobacteria bacterium]|tara:strand:+ start:753 stop:1181 length:429 start_codon:yes stop_codon:yes gene_type:complete
MKSSHLVIVLLAYLALLSGCIVYVDEDDGAQDVVYNYSPEILVDPTWWACDYDWTVDDHFFEFQAGVEDLDGSDDVALVSVSLYEAGTDYLVDSFGLYPEGDGIWGGLVWESESYAICGEALDVLVEAMDHHEAWDALWLLY